MLRFFFLIIINITISCTNSSSLHEMNRSVSQFYVSCPPHLIYCYRKSDLICRKEFRVLTVANKEDHPEMIIVCK